jgi:hypothetical protein
MYDVGEITRELQSRFALFADRAPDAEPKTNKATPENVAVLLVSLRELTAELAERRRVVQVQTIADDLWDADFAKWRGRLFVYTEHVAAAAPGDRQAILWDVTAPLLLGFFGGEGGKLPQQPIDAITPFTLANQLDVGDDWRERQLELLLEDLEQGAKDVVGGTSDIVKVGVAVVVGLTLAKVFGR